MQQTPFHAYYTAQILLGYLNDENLIPAYASSNVEIYPYQIAAARFALRSSYLHGVVLCDECSLGKTFEALLISTQLWYEGHTRQIVILPVNMIDQWVKKIESSFSVPYVVIDSEETMSLALQNYTDRNNKKAKSKNEEIYNFFKEFENLKKKYPKSEIEQEGDNVEPKTETMEDDEKDINPFSQNALVITTYEFAVEKAQYIKNIKWDLAIFDEADRLNKTHTGENKTASVLKDATDGSFKLLLTPMPIEMSIKDVYGLIYFIDESVLPASADEFYNYYFRHPERYQELASWASKYCFRTLKGQVTNYVNFTRRVPYTASVDFTKDEKRLYDQIIQYVQDRKSLAYPNKSDRDIYNMGLKWGHILSSSAQAITVTIKRAINRLEERKPDEHNKELQIRFDNEFKFLTNLYELAKKIDINGKMKALLSLLKKCFSYLRKIKVAQKAIIFTDNLTTLNCLYKLLNENGFVVLTYSGSNARDYSIMERFRNDKKVQVLIATDDVAKGLDIEFCPVVVNYDLSSNAPEMDQRVSRCHRQGQKSDVMIINLINKNNQADVRYLELINKRILQFHGIFGMSDTILGNFDIDFMNVLTDMRHTNDVLVDFENNLAEHEMENRKIVENTEEAMFTTFTKEVADKITVTPQYIKEQSSEINDNLWEVVKWFFNVYFPEKRKRHLEYEKRFNSTQFNQRNQNNQPEDEYYFEIDDISKTITVHSNDERPVLFYYWTGSRYRPYTSLPKYGMAKDFKPHYAKITLSSVIGRGILGELECADQGTLTIISDLEPCLIGFYCVEIQRKDNSSCNYCSEYNYNILVGKTVSGRVLSEEECERIMKLPVVDYSIDDKNAKGYLYSNELHLHSNELQDLVPIDMLIQKYKKEQNLNEAEEIEKMKLVASKAKAELEHTLDDLKSQIAEAEQAVQSETSRIKQMQAQKKLRVLQEEHLQKGERLFYDCMNIDIDLEKKIDEFRKSNEPKVITKVQFLLRINTNKGAS